MSKLNLIHLSDLHYLQGKEENHEVVFNAFFKDLEEQLKINKFNDNYLVISGDIAYAGDSEEQYENFITKFDFRLNALGLTKNKRICVPGNHDVSRNNIKASLVVHEGVVSQKLDETNFNDHILTANNVLIGKFDNYLNFEKKFADFGVYSKSEAESSVIGKGWNINENVGIFCLNSALCSSGGLNGMDGKFLTDESRLAVATRELHKWVSESKTKIKILVLHHPLNFLTEWAQNELEILLKKDFHLCLSGHNHNQTLCHSLHNGSQLVACSAPALFSKKVDDLGYASILLSNEKGVEEIQYRQWTKHHSFVAGVNFSNSDNGKVLISEAVNSLAYKERKNTQYEIISRYLNKRFEDALLSFSSQPKVWILPTLSTVAETDDKAKKAETFDANQLLKVKKSTRVLARHEFGLSCLALYLAKEAWRQNHEFWLYLDTKNLKPNNSLTNAIISELQVSEQVNSNVKCILLDSWSAKDKESVKILEQTAAKFPNIPIICMETLDENKLFSVQNEALEKFDFEFFYLWALQRAQIRELINQYNAVRYIGEEDAVTSKLISDLSVLNLYRTPLNCLTLLKVSENNFDENPVNRTEVIKKVLFLLFNVDEIPKYVAKPDLKDCEFVLGYFCESMVKRNEFYFTRDYFLHILKKCCSEKFMELEVHIVFDVLYKNNIIVSIGNLFCFRFTYWIHYFLAQRMHHDSSFAAYMFENLRYANLPEVVEFYTGIDRQREDALKVLLADLKACQRRVTDTIGFNPDFNPYKHAIWTPTPENLELMQKEISEGVQESNLPAVVKDHYADHEYDRARPYYQEIKNILEEQSVLYMMQAAKAASKALRNSDYADSKIKKELLQEIINCWELMTKIGVILIPILAEHGKANYDGAGFILVGEFGKTFEEKVQQILIALPISTVNWGKEDLFSQKMGPLLIDQAENEISALRKHELMLLLTIQRPNKWAHTIKNYILSIHGNSFFLFDLARVLRNQHAYSFCTTNTLNEIESLIQQTSKRHSTIGLTKRERRTRPVKLVSRLFSSLLGSVSEKEE